ncbi:MAG: hypothetical protein GXZ07_04995 [Firmicutes bacterium]|nr:hypothetical protein [Bacillota bacterium]
MSPIPKKHIVKMSYKEALNAAYKEADSDELPGVRYIVDLRNGQFTVANNGKELGDIFAESLNYRIHQRIIRDDAKVEKPKEEAAPNEEKKSYLKKEIENKMSYKEALSAAYKEADSTELPGVRYIVDLRDGNFTVAKNGKELGDIYAESLNYRAQQRIIRDDLKDAKND